MPLREALYEVELSSIIRNALQQLEIPLHSVSPLQQLFSQFYGTFNKGACAHFSFLVPKSTARQVAEEIAQCNRALTPNLRNLQLAFCFLVCVCVNVPVNDLLII